MARSMRRAGTHGWIALALIWAVGMSAGPAAAQMHLPGSFAVNEQGAATYAIPIQVPPGTGGVEPKLQLTYNSRGDNGILGVGWSLSGLSAITRCPQTLAQDNNRGAVKFNQADRFCLDGQRLMVLGTAATYGNPGTEYRTERESFRKVVAVSSAGGNAANGPEQFSVKTPDGLTMTYGGTTDSRVEALGSTVVTTWALNRVSDINGNYLTVTYTEDSIAGTFRPARIDYTGNSVSGLAPQNAVVFDYQDRAAADIITAYHNGTYTRNSVRIAKIRTIYGAAAAGALEYRLTYGLSSTTSRTTLNTITLCATSDGACLPAISVSRPTGSMAWTSTNSTAPSWVFEQDLQAYAGDFNGDGRTDLVFRKVTGSGWATTPVLFSNGDGSWTATNIASPPFNGQATTSWINNPATSVTVGDFDGDGKADLALKKAGFGTTPIFFSNGDGSWRVTNGATPSWANEDNAVQMAGDFNGDGRTDILMRKPTGWATSPMLFSNGDGTWTTTNLTTPTFNGQSTTAWINSTDKTVVVGDFNGDGKADVAIKNSGSLSWGTIPAFFSNGDGTFTVTNGTAPSWANEAPAQMYAADFNGDGKTDLMFRKSTGWGTTPMLFSKGDGSWQATNNTTPNVNGQASTGWVNSEQTAIAIGDFNGDGRSDFAVKNIGTLEWYTVPVFLSNGDGTWSVWNPSTPAWANETGSAMFVGDYNGDGLSDLVFRKSATWATTPMLSSAAPSGDMISEIAEGLGSRITITTATLPQMGAAYTRAASSSYPKVVVASPTPVVKQVTVSDGIGGVRTSQYSYDSAVVELGTGRGFLGFARFSAKDVDKPITTTTQYRQDWPYVGMPSQTTTAYGTPGINLVTLSTTEALYTCQDPASAPLVALPGGTASNLSFQPGAAGNCSVGPLSRYQVWASRTTAARRDLNGAALPGSRTDVMDMDKFGNAGRVKVETFNPDGTASGHHTVTDTLYSNNESTWIAGRKIKAEVTVTTP